MLRPAPLFFVLLSAGASGLLSSACAPDALAPTSSAVDIASINARLQGTWHLVDFRPDVALEPMLSMWLQNAKGNMSIRFDGGSLQADSTSVAFPFHYDRPFSIPQAGGDTFVLTTSTASGDTLTSNCQFTDPNHFQFHSQTEPFQGTGVLERVAPAPGAR